MPEPSQEELVAFVHLVLESPFTIPGLSDEDYERLHDDDDGTGQGSIRVFFGKDSDIRVEITPTHNGRPLRFRTFFGGGKSLRVRNALMILALAIKLDNEEHSQNIKSEDDS